MKIKIDMINGITITHVIDNMTFNEFGNILASAHENNIFTTLGTDLVVNPKHIVLISEVE